MTLSGRFTLPISRNFSLSYTWTPALSLSFYLSFILSFYLSLSLFSPSLYSAVYYENWARPFGHTVNQLGLSLSLLSIYLYIEIGHDFLDTQYDTIVQLPCSFHVDQFGQNFLEICRIWNVPRRMLQ